MSYIDERNQKRKEALIRLFNHRGLGIVFTSSILCLVASAWVVYLVVAFLFLFMEWFDMLGYKFSACTGKTTSNDYQERDYENVMAYKWSNAAIGAVLLLLVEPLIILWYSVPDAYLCLYAYFNILFHGS